MRIFIELPSWIGDAIMCTPAIENILNLYKHSHVTMLGSYATTSLFSEDKRIQKLLINDTKKYKFRYFCLYSLAKKIQKVDLAISFRRSISSKIMMKFIKADKKFSYKRLSKDEIHQAIRYNDFVNYSLKTSLPTKSLHLSFKAYKFKNKTLGINPGATYGSAKRWYPSEFAKVAIKLSQTHDIIIFGSKNEEKMAKDIENILMQNGVKNFQNLAGKTSIKELCELIGGLDIFLTNDSGPMHIAACYKVKTISIFGPTNFTETNQWQNENEFIITKNLLCSPCMKRKCPKKHHECMKSICANDVLEVIKNI